MSNQGAEWQIDAQSALNLTPPHVSDIYDFQSQVVTSFLMRIIISTVCIDLLHLVNQGCGNTGEFINQRKVGTRLNMFQPKSLTRCLGQVNG